MGSATESASTSIRGSLDSLVDVSLNHQWARWPVMMAALTPDQLRHTAEDTGYHLEFIASALWFDEQALLDDYLVWCKVLFANLNLPAEWIEGSLACISKAIESDLPRAEADAALGFIDAGLATFRSASIETSSFILPGSPLGPLARGYLTAALDGERSTALRLLLDAVASGTSVRDIYLWVFQPVQREVGRLWLLNEVTVAQEHYITAMTQLAMAKLYEHVFVTAPGNRTLVAACVGGELHELGARMVADFFEMEQWTTYYLGANAPKAAIVQAVEDRGADVLALSATMAFHVGEIAETIALLRATESTSQTKVLVGGYPFNVAPALWHRVGADGWAPTAESAPKVAAELLST